MAYAALESLSQTIDKALMNHHKYSVSVNQKERFISIREYVNFLLSFLEDFPEKANRWEGQIRHVANEIEDMIEHFMWNQIQSRYKWTSQTGLGFEDQLKKATEKTGLIVGEMMEDRLGDSPAPISSSSLTVAGKYDKLVGLDEDLMAIKSRLCGESSKLLVIPIVGMGGIGKTTIARNAYEDPLMMEHFHVRAWVSISQHYNKEEIVSSLLDSVKWFDEQMPRQKNEKLMAEKVYKSLKGRKYLIVMDDVWSTEVLDDVRNIFPDDNNGSQIMLTTRLSDVTSYADSCGPLHEMRFLDVNQSWDLLRWNVFGNDEDCPHELEDIGKVIAQSCRGLPLAVVLLAGILSTVVKTRASWEEIAKNVNSVVDGQFEKILSLSYMHLPHHLRPCFLFLGGFPEDSNICVPRLIKLWVAEGFLRRDDR